jgi:hypothetical protein
MGIILVAVVKPVLQKYFFAEYLDTEEFAQKNFLY